MSAFYKVLCRGQCVRWQKLRSGLLEKLDVRCRKLCWYAIPTTIVGNLVVFSLPKSGVVGISYQISRAKNVFVDQCDYRGRHSRGTYAVVSLCFYFNRRCTEMIIERKNQITIQPAVGTDPRGHKCHVNLTVLSD